MTEKRFAGILLLLLLPPSGILHAAAYGQADAKERSAAVENLLALPGVVVEERGSVPALDQSGIHLGDVLLSWRQQVSRPGDSSPSQGEILSIFDWFWLQTDKSPFGTIAFELKRGTESQSIPVTTGLLELRIRPNLIGEVLEVYKKGASSIANGDIEDGLCWWEQIARLARKKGDPTTLAWILIRIAATQSEHEQWSDAALVLESALREERNPLVRSVLLDHLGTTFRKWGRNDLAYEIYRTALEERISLARDSIGIARAYLNLGFTRYEKSPLAAEEFLQEAIERLQKLAPASASLASALNARGLIHLSKDEFATAQSDFEASLLLYSEREPGGLNLARVMNNLGRTASSIGNLPQARYWHRAALNLRKLLAPCSAEVAQSLHNLAATELGLGNNREAKDLSLEALAILRDSKVSSRELGLVLEVLAHLASKDGDLDDSERYYRRSLDIFRTIAPESMDIVRAMANTSTILSAKGDLEGAEMMLKEALRLGERIAPNSLGITQTMTNLGLMKSKRGELEEAEDLLQSSLQIIERKAPGTEDEAAALNNLGLIAFDRGDLDEANLFHQRSLEIARKLPRPNLDEAHSLTNLGNIAASEGKFQKAQELYKRALSIKESMAAGSHEVASSLGSLGHLYWLKGNLREARKYYDAVLNLPESDPPSRVTTLINLATLLTDSQEFEAGISHFQEALMEVRKNHLEGLQEATALHGIGTILNAQGKRTEALDYFHRSAEVLDTSSRELGGSEDVKAGFRSRYQEIYTDLVDLLVQTGQAATAMQVLEGYRARALLNMLAERDLSFSKDMPLDLERERRSLETRYDAIQDRAWRGLASADELSAIRSRLSEIARQIARVSPRLSALRYPKPLTAEQVRDALDVGTVMLYYYVGRNETKLWVIEAQGSLILLHLNVSRNRLREDVDRYRSLLLGTRTALAPRRAALLSASESLFQTLIAPAEDIVARNKRVLVIPDGPLRALPFASLTRRVRGERDIQRSQYMIEWKPFHATLSATLFSQLKALRREREYTDSSRLSAKLLVAFGDPIYPMGLKEKPGTVGDAKVRSMPRHNFDFSPLPASRSEVEGIVNLFPDSATARLGHEATEADAKSLPRETRIVHFATHATLDERFPLNSAVVLSVPEKFEEGKDNGLLQAWEIFEQVRIDADLVVLSACESGLGKEMGGEGLIGLTRAFQYAGARSVMASLWKISDRTTAELMVRFYKHLKAGLPKDEALRAAQMELIRGPIQVKNEKGEVEEIDASAPYYWAAFQIYGDWQ